MLWRWNGLIASGKGRKVVTAEKGNKWALISQHCTADHEDQTPESGSTLLLNRDNSSKLAGVTRVQHVSSFEDLNHGSMSIFLGA